jgi:NADPH:quinone reductase-like Zn-dependent oxidoreductase
MAMATMHAIRMHDFGGPEVLSFEEAPRPEPGAGDVLVRIHAAGVNPIDWKLREGQTRNWVHVELPAVPGLDFSGTVEKLGSGVTKFKVGDDVFGRTSASGSGSYAEFTIVKGDDLARKPSSLDHIHAAAIPTAGLTAWQGLIESVPPGDAIAIREGQGLLVHGGAGGVGSFALQFGKLRRARVTTTAAAENESYLRELGADQVIDYRRERFEQIVRDLDAVFDTVGGDTQRRSLQVLKRDGMLVSTVGIQFEAEAKEKGVRTVAMQAKTSVPHLEEIAQLVASGEVEAPVTEVFPLRDARRAHEESQGGHVRGKIVLSVLEEIPAGMGPGSTVKGKRT